jgi:hypothetical protein
MTDWSKIIIGEQEGLERTNRLISFHYILVNLYKYKRSSMYAQWRQWNCYKLDFIATEMYME